MPQNSQSLICRKEKGGTAQCALRGRIYLSPIDCCCITGLPRQEGTIMPGTYRLPASKFQVHSSFFTSFVKKGKGVDRAATTTLHWPARWSTGSSPHLRGLPPSIKCLSLLPKAKVDWAKGKNSWLHNIRSPRYKFFFL